MKELFIDIETAPLYEGLEGYPKVLREKLVQKYPEDGYSKAGLHAEFGKIVCISVGYMEGDQVHTKSLVGSEQTILIDLGIILKRQYKIVGHNILDFDLPFIQRRYVVNDIKVPQSIRTAGKKPWDLEAIIGDTMVMWSGTQWKYRVSLNVLCELLGVESPKTDMDGSKVGEAFYNGEIERIAKYCEKDVVATAKVYAILKNRGL